MKFILQKKFIKLYNIIYIIICRFITKKIIKTSNHSYVAMFHDITLKENSKDKYSLSVKEFKKYLKILENTKKKIVFKIEECYENSQSVMITFDDGLKSIIEIVFPIMKEKNIPFTIFIVSDFIGKSGYLNIEDLIILKNSGICTIGLHSKTHPIFRNLSIEEKNWELKKSKEEIENILQKKILDFAFPYGSFLAVDKESVRIAKNLYKNVYTTKQLCTIFKRKVIPRINIPYYLKEK